MDPYKLLIKFPTRERPEKFFSTLDLYVDLLEDLENYEFVISCDEDDSSMNNSEVIDKLKSYKNLVYYFSSNNSKVEAINSNIENHDFDIILLASDDMIPQQKGYDNIIRSFMKKSFEDTDGVLWFADGYQNERLNTLSILGKKYYQRFGYIYNPEYKSLWCDNEFTIIASALGKQVYIPFVIIKHEHVIWKNQKWDDLQIKNQEYDSSDHETFKKRIQNNFYL
jgi:hypothetical protein